MKIFQKISYALLLLAFMSAILLSANYAEAGLYRNTGGGFQSNLRSTSYGSGYGSYGGSYGNYSGGNSYTSVVASPGYVNYTGYNNYGYTAPSRTYNYGYNSGYYSPYSNNSIYYGNTGYYSRYYYGTGSGYGYGSYGGGCYSWCW